MGFAGRRIAEGSVWLSAGQLASTAVAFAGSIIIARLLTPSEYGLISVALMFPGLLLGLLDFGVSEALIRFTPMDEGKGYVSTAFLFKTAIAVATSLVTFTLSGYMAQALGRPYVAPMIRILSVYVLGEVVAGAASQVLTGAGEYGKVGLLSIARSSVRIIASILLISMGLGVYGSIWGFSIASALTPVISLIYVSKYLRGIGFKTVLFKEIMEFSLPLYIPTILGLPINQVVNIFLARYATNAELGNYSIASNLSLPLGIVGGAMATSIYSTLPLLANREDKMREVVCKSVIYTSIVVIPIAMGLAVFSKPLTYIIYGSQYSLAPVYLSLSALTGLTAVLGSYVIGSYLKSIGETVKTMNISLLNYAIYVPLALLLIPTYRVVGLITASVLAGFISTIYGLYIVQKDLGLNIVGIRNIMILGALSLPGGLAWLISLAPMNSLHKMLLGFMVYIVSLIVILPIVIKEDELLELIEIAKGIKLLNYIVPKILSMILRLINRGKKL
jgi:O-antigen/teichoic acid export membrane protein